MKWGGRYKGGERSLEERLWEHIVVVENCWEWIGYRGSDGYGTFRLSPTKCGRPHRASYELYRGPIPAGMTIDHLCRNRGCVNPDHLEVVTQKENCLRGNGFYAKNARQTHCPQGHPYDEANTYHDPRGGRICRICRQRSVVKCREKAKLRESREVK